MELIRGIAGSPARQAIVSQLVTDTNDVGNAIALNSSMFNGARVVGPGIAGMLVAETVRALAVNPESQRQELEADQIGLFLMADAGFDPTHAIDFWVRFSLYSC
mgnify:CR=1 FL=1